MTPVEHDELVARLADLYLTEDDAKHALLGTARLRDFADRADLLQEAANAYRAVVRARIAFYDALPPEEERAISRDASAVAKEVNDERFNRKLGIGKYAPAAEVQP